MFLYQLTWKSYHVDTKVMLKPTFEYRPAQTNCHFGIRATRRGHHIDMEVKVLM